MKLFDKSILAVSIAAASTLLTACGGSSNDSAISTSATTKPTITPTNPVTPTNPTPTNPTPTDPKPSDPVPTNPTTPTNPTNPTTPTTPNIPQTIKAQLTDHGMDFTWEQGEALKVAVINQDNQPVAIKSCASDDETRLAIAADCSALTIHRLGQSTFTVTANNNLTTKITVNGVPARSALAVNASGMNEANRVVTPQGNILSWGSNGQKQLATSNTESVEYLQHPMPVVTADGKALGDIYQVAHGNVFAYALNGQGQVYGWGLGTQPTTLSKQPSSKFPELVVMPDLKTPLSHIVQLATEYYGKNTSAALGVTDEGKVVLWGSSGGSPHPIYLTDNDGLPVTNIRTVSFGFRQQADNVYVSYHVYGVDNKGQVWDWKIGNNGLKNELVGLLKDKNGTTLTNVRKIVSSPQSALALTKQGQVYAWGSNSNGNLGDATLPKDTYQLNTPNLVTINGSPLTNIKDIAINFRAAYAVNQAGNVYAWGFGATGELGDGANHPLGNETNIPSLVVDETGMGKLSNIIAVTGAHNGAIALKADGTLVGWGNNWNGLLTQDTPKSGKNYFTPVTIYASKDSPLKIDLSKYTQLN